MANKPNQANTAVVYMDQHGAGFTFGGKSYDDWCNITPEQDERICESDDELLSDRLRSVQFQKDIETVVKLGCEFVIDHENNHHENNHHENPVPVKGYLRTLKAYIKEIS